MNSRSTGVFCEALKQIGLKADIFTFVKSCRTSFQAFVYVEWDDLAFIPITTFSDGRRNGKPREKKGRQEVRENRDRREADELKMT